MVIAHIGLALAERRGRAALAVAAPFMVVALAFVGYGFAVRTIAGGDTGGGYAVSYDPGTILRTYVLQMFPPLPASNFLFDGGDLAAQPTAAELGGALWRGAVVFAIVAWVGWRHRSTPLRPGLLTTMAVLGALIMLSPVALISLAEKYQHELSAATGYLPVIMQSFGWALIAAAAVLGLVRVAGARSAWAQGMAVLACAGALGLGAAVSGYDVVRVAATEVPRAVVSDTLHHAAARGVLDGLPEGSTVMLPEADVGSGKTGWGDINTFDAMLFDQTGRRYDGRVTPPAPVGTCPPDPPGVIVPSDCAPIEARAAWMRVGARRRQANVIVAPISGGGPLGRPARELFAYIEGEDLSPPSVAGAGTDGKPWTSRGLQWTRRAGGGDWALLQATPPAPYPVADTLLDTRRTVDLTAAVPTGRLVRTLGTRRVLP
jgi:hypothetical protein